MTVTRSSPVALMNQAAEAHRVDLIRERACRPRPPWPPAADAPGRGRAPALLLLGLHGGPTPPTRAGHETPRGNIFVRAGTPPKTEAVVLSDGHRSPPCSACCPTASPGTCRSE